MVLLEIKNLKMYYKLENEYVRAVDGISLSLDRGEILGIVGESGSGKSSVAYSILKILPKNAKILEGQIVFDGINLLNLSDEEMRKIRWKKISMIFQSALNALDPIFRVKNFLEEILNTHTNLSKEKAKNRIVTLIKKMELKPSILNRYPFELSGGMQQRVIIASSLICEPLLIIADEPTTALDLVLQDIILQEIKNLQKQLNFALIMISHNISVIAETCDRTAIMYGGKIVEQARTTKLFHDSHHPYTIALFKSFPNISGPIKRLLSIPGKPPSLIDPPAGCRFSPRCPIAEDICSEKEPTFVKVDDEHFSRCHFALDPKIKNIKFRRVYV